MKKLTLKNALLVILVCATCVLLASCTAMLEGVLEALQETAEPAAGPNADAPATPTPDPAAPPDPAAMPTPDPTLEPASWPSAEALAAIAGMPYYGDISKCAMTAEQALAYAEAVRAAENVPQRHFYDSLIPMLIDISGDGIPLLLLIPTQGGNEAPVTDYHLYGYSGGRIRDISYIGGDFVHVTVDGESQLCNIYLLYDIDSTYGRYSFYRIQNGAEELIWETDLMYTEDMMEIAPNRYYVAGTEVSRDVYIQTRDSLDLMCKDGAFFVRGWPYLYFERGDPAYDYINRPFARADVVQMLQDYAAA